MKNRCIYLFLKLSLDNLYRVALKYRMKKEIDYSLVDFYYNQASANHRPVKNSSYLKEQEILLKSIKKINRYFKVKEISHMDEEIVEEKDLKISDIKQFASYEAQAFHLYLYLKNLLSDEQNISKQEKQYLYEVTFNSINNGGLKRYSVLKKRRMFFESIEEILSKHKYKVHEASKTYQQFILDNTNMKSYYSRL